MLSACAGGPSLPENSVSGRLGSTPDAWPRSSVVVYAARYSGDAAGGGYYVLEPDRYPHAELGRGGRFQLTDLEEGSYILLAGPTPEEALRLVSEDGKPVILEFTAGQSLDLGIIYPAP